MYLDGLATNGSMAYNILVIGCLPFNYSFHHYLFNRECMSALIQGQQSNTVETLRHCIRAAALHFCPPEDFPLVILCLRLCVCSFYISPSCTALCSMTWNRLLVSALTFHISPITSGALTGQQRGRALDFVCLCVVCFLRFMCSS